MTGPRLHFKEAPLLLIALKPHGYEGRNIQVGQQYEAEAKFAVALVGAGASRYATESKAPAVPSVEARLEVFVSENREMVPARGEVKPRKKRQYKRRTQGQP